MKKHLAAGAFILIAVLVSAFFYYKFDPVLLTKLSFYVNLANPYVRIVRVDEGLRREQVAEVVGEKLDWGVSEKKEFLNSVNVEGQYFPKTYLIFQGAAPATVVKTMANEYKAQVSKVKKSKSAEILNEETVLKIASLIQREAAGKHDMKLISGIIWNRIYSGMKLQIDATLQYAKGSEAEGWWQQVDSTDKKIKSSYNTYLHEGLPPGAIANPGFDAISAAYNPTKTDCLFYLHDKNRKIHCTKTYEEHKKKIELYLK